MSMSQALFALANLFLCAGVVFVAACRLNAMSKDTLTRVVLEYVAYVAAGFTSGLQPWWGEWPQWGSLATSGALFFGLLMSWKAWAGDKPPDIATMPGGLH